MLLHDFLRKSRAEKLSSLTKQISKIVRSPTTERKSLSDYPKIQDYLDSKFPGIKVSTVPIYLVEPDLMSGIKMLKGCAGCYVPHLRIIMVHKKICMMENSSRGLFFSLLSKEKTSVEVEDILVHEMVHAVSDMAERNGRHYLFDEEEFVFTNCIDFYKDKGMDNDRIVNSVFLPFCVNIMFESELRKICLSVLKYTPDSFSKSFLNKHAEVLVPELLRFARDFGKKMIDTYERWGRGIELPGPVVNDACRRLRSVDMEC